MSDQSNEQRPLESAIIIRFAAANSTLLDIHYQNVSPFQSMLAAWTLRRDAEATIEAASEERKRQQAQPPPKLVVPEGYGGIIPK